MSIRLSITTRARGTEGGEGESARQQLLGSLTHKAIELFLLQQTLTVAATWPKGKALREEISRSVRAAWASLSPVGIQESEGETIQEEALHIISTAFSSREITALFSHDAAAGVRIQPEREVVDEEGRTFRVDLLIASPPAMSLTVVDFKTHRPHRPDEREKMVRQLRKYCSLIRSAVGRAWHVEGFLCFLDPPAVEKVLR